MAEALAAGAKCLDDLEVARADRVQEELRGFGVPPPQTRREVSAPVLPRPHRPAQQGLAPGAPSGPVPGRTRRRSHARLRFDLRPLPLLAPPGERTRPTSSATPCTTLVCFVAGLGICLHAKLRRGRVHTAKGLLPFVDECPAAHPRRRRGSSRFDSGFHDGKLFEALERRCVTYLCGVPLNPRILGVVRGIEDWGLGTLHRQGRGEVAEFGYRHGRLQGVSAATS